MTNGFQAASGVTGYASCQAITQGGRLHGGHVAGNALKHGGFAAQEVVVKQKVATYALVGQSLVR